MDEVKQLIKNLTALIEQRFTEIKHILQSTLNQSSPIGKVKKKRKLNAYQLFMRECVKNETGTYPERFSKCATKYKEKKRNG